jgi:dTDP-glucose 4,6-dehydratase
MRLLVTGGAGFIGSNFVRRQVKNSSNWQTITVLDSLTYAGNRKNLAECETSPKFNFVHGDILNQDLVTELMKKSDIVVHFAAESHVDRSIKSSHKFVETNVLGTQVLLNSALENEISTFVHVSTDEVYGSILEGSWPETDPINPNSPYSASKAASDLLALSFERTYGMDVRVTRSSNNYGPYQFPEKVIPLFITNLIDGLKVPLYGNGKNIRDWLHVDDHCYGIELVLEKGIPGQIYNIGGGTELTNLELTHLILENMQRDESAIESVEDRKGHDLRYSVDISKISRELGYTPQTTFIEGLIDTINWYVSNDHWWRPLKQAK